MRYYFWITGLKFREFKDPQSRTRIISNGIAIHIPLLIWLFTGYALAHHLFELDMAWSIAIALTLATIIFIVERLILMLPKITTSVGLPRIVLALLISCIGSVATDSVIFKNEIEKQALVESTYDPKLLEFDKKIEELTLRRNEEMNGIGGSKRVGCGPQCRIHNEDIQRTINEKEEYRKESSLVEKKFGLLDSTQKLFNFMKKNTLAAVLFVMIFVTFMLLEMMVLFSKYAHSSYETEDDQIENAKRQNTRKIIEEYQR